MGDNSANDIDQSATIDHVRDPLPLIDEISDSTI